MSNKKRYFMNKVIPVPYYPKTEKAINNLFVSESKVSSKQELEETIERMKMYDEGYRFDNYEPHLTDDEQMLSDKMNETRLKINCVISSDAEAKRYPPANPFYEVKKYIDNQRELGVDTGVNLKEVFYKMPKGGNLHIHSSATYNVEMFIMDLVKMYPNEIYVLTEDFMNKSGEYLRGTLFKFEKDSLENPIPNAFKLLSDFIQGEGKKELVKLLSFTDDTDGYIEDIGYIWGGFNKIFKRISLILNVRNIFKMYYKNAFMLLVKDNIDYCELRCGIADTLYDNHNYVVENRNSPMPNIDIKNPEFIKLLKDAYVEVVDEVDKGDFQLKLILTAKRGDMNDSRAIGKAIGKMKLTKEWMDDSCINSNPIPLAEVSDSKFIIGFDLVSEEDTGITTKKFVDALYENGCEKLLKDVPLYLHDGESNRYDDDNLYTAYLIGTERIGHGLNLFRYRYLQDMVRVNHNTLEVCPISNQVLRYISDTRIHPIYGYLNSGLECVIASDDPQIFGNDGLTYDFWIAYTGSDMDLKAVKKLIKNSYIYSGMNEAEKKIMMGRWEQKWNKFILECNQWFA